MTYTEGDTGVPVSPLLDLSIKETNNWNVKHANLRVKSMQISVSGGYVEGEDVLTLPEVPGFESTWDAEQGVLTISAVPGFDFTENTADDYEDAQVEQVDVSEVLESTAATARIVQFEEALRQVKFASSTAGSFSRQMSLSVAELLTADTIATISVAQVINTPDPPEILVSAAPLSYTEKAPLTPVDADMEVSHLIRSRCRETQLATRKALHCSNCHACLALS